VIQVQTASNGLEIRTEGARQLFDCIGMCGQWEYLRNDRLDHHEIFSGAVIEQSARQLRQDLVQNVKDPCIVGDLADKLKLKKGRSILVCHSVGAVVLERVCFDCP
jgi:hypothetical protein